MLKRERKQEKEIRDEGSGRGLKTKRDNECEKRQRKEEKKNEKEMKRKKSTIQEE